MTSIRHASTAVAAGDDLPRAPFPGSYRPGDVDFLLTPMQLAPVDVAEKERLIQSGKRHYSEMLSREAAPSARYMEVFHQAVAINKVRMARGLLDLAAIIAERRPGVVTLVSLARAGTPVGVALRHLLRRVCGREVRHYSVSIIRDRGIDTTALRFILGAESCDPASLVFVDGWTGKGVIARELRRSVADFNRVEGVTLDATLFALTDLAGVGVAPSDEDYLIPSCVLNATVSGLVSRSVLNASIGPGVFHGCVYYEELAPLDVSRWFVDEILGEAHRHLAEGYQPCPRPVDPAGASARCGQALAGIKKRFGIEDENFIKPGIGEATRVLLRRLPERVILRDPGSPEVAHLLRLAREKGVAWEADPALPYQAISLIKGVSDA